jgi:hypothetical protein
MSFDRYKNLQPTLNRDIAGIAGFFISPACCRPRRANLHPSDGNNESKQP